MLLPRMSDALGVPGIHVLRALLVLFFVLSVLSAALNAQSADTSQPSSSTLLRLHERTPLGTELLRFVPQKKLVRIYATLESPQFENATLVDRAGGKLLLDKDGQPFTHYPAELIIRFTVTGRVRGLITSPLLLDDDDDPAVLASQLHFRLKAFNGLDARELQPLETKMIGVPAEIPYDERIYLIRFDTRDVPISERMMFEIFGPRNDRLARFAVQFY